MILRSSAVVQCHVFGLLDDLINVHLISKRYEM